MRPVIVFGTAVTAAVLTMIADVIGGVVAAEQLSVTSGVSVRSFLVIAALAITAVLWWMRMRPTDRPEALFVGLLGGWLLNFSSWSGSSFAGQLFTSAGFVTLLIDLVLWAGVAFALVLVLSRSSTTSSR